VKPKQTLEYRLAAGKVAGGAIRVPVAPSVRLELGADGLYGAVRPAFPDSRIQIQRESPRGWATIAATRADANGKFTATLALSFGSYRARIGSRRGYVAGTSPPVQVTS
jgi:hypothetical protein